MNVDILDLITSQLLFLLWYSFEGLGEATERVSSCQGSALSGEESSQDAMAAEQARPYDRGGAVEETNAGLIRIDWTELIGGENGLAQWTDVPWVQLGNFSQDAGGGVTKIGSRGARFLKCRRDLPILLEHLYRSAGISDFTTTCQVRTTAVPGIC
jgi:hypothetical protein